MSLDRLQSKPGIFQVAPENVYGTTGTASTVASLQYPGGFAVGGQAGFAAGQAAGVGGALFMTPVPAGATSGYAMASTAATVSHNGAGIVAFNNSATQDNAQLQAPAYAGQFLVLENVGTKSISFATAGTVNNWSTTGTTAVQVLQAAFTVNSGGSRALLYAAPHLASTTGQYPLIWAKIA